MAMTERLVVLLEPDEKAALKADAALAQLSMGEYVKRAVTVYGHASQPDDVAELERLAVELSEAASYMSARLDGSIARIDRALDPQREIALRTRLEAEARALPDAAIASIGSLLGISTAAYR